MAARAEKFTSIFNPKKHEKPTQYEPVYFPPEIFRSIFESSPESSEEEVDLKTVPSWDIAVRYHEFKTKPSLKNLAQHLRRISASAILERAQQVLGSVVRPMDQKVTPLRDVPVQAESVDLDLDETIESSPLALAGILNPKLGNFPLTEDDIWMSFSVPRRQPIVFCVDTSLSMTGEKLALTAVAIAVVLLEFPDDPIGIVAFENEAKVLKRPDERLSIQQLVERFLDVPAQGYTHLEEGLKAALQQVRNSFEGSHGKRPSTILLSDGKYTAGKDPTYLAQRFPHLIVLKMGKERASLELCHDLAKRGHGLLREVDEYEVLPGVMYNVVKDLLRGRSLA